MKFKELVHAKLKPPVIKFINFFWSKDGGKFLLELIAVWGFVAWIQGERISSRDDRISVLQNQVEDLKSKKNEKEIDFHFRISVLQDTIKSLEERIATREDSIGRLMARLELREYDYKELGKQYEKYNIDSKEKMSTFDSQIRGKVAQIQKLENTVKNLETEIKSIYENPEKSSLSRIYLQYKEESQNKIKTLQNEIDKRDQNIQKLHDEIKYLVVNEIITSTKVSEHIVDINDKFYKRGKYSERLPPPPPHSEGIKKLNEKVSFLEELLKLAEDSKKQP